MVRQAKGIGCVNSDTEAGAMFGTALTQTDRLCSVVESRRAEKRSLSYSRTRLRSDGTKALLPGGKLALGSL